MVVLFYLVFHWVVLQQMYKDLPTISIVHSIFHYIIIVQVLYYYTKYSIFEFELWIQAFFFHFLSGLGLTASRMALSSNF